jgi:hypothetical protein
VGTKRLDVCSSPDTVAKIEISISPEISLKVDFSTSPPLRRFLAPLGRSVVDFGGEDMVPHVAAQKMHQRL